MIRFALARTVITTPVDGGRITGTAVSVAGRGSIGTTVTVRDSTTGAVGCRTTVSATGRWSCRMRLGAAGRRTLQAQETDPAAPRATYPLSVPVHLTVLPGGAIDPTPTPARPTENQSSAARPAPTRTAAVRPAPIRTAATQNAATQTTAPSDADRVAGPAVVDQESAAPDPERSRPPEPAVPGRSPTQHPDAAAGGRGGQQLPIGLHLAAGVLTPGRVATFVGTLGPYPGTEPTAVVLTGRVNRGVRYSSVITEPTGDCAVATTVFRCTLTLPPGGRATLQVRLVADALRAPPYARQQLSAQVAGGRTNALTQVTRVAVGPTEVSRLSDAITGTPGALVTLLLLYLLALAAAEWERQHPSSRTHPRGPKGSRP